MGKVVFMNNHSKLNDFDLEEIARQVKEGFSSGCLNNGEGRSIYWELNVNIWEDK